MVIYNEYNDKRKKERKPKMKRKEGKRRVKKDRENMRKEEK